MKKLFTAAILLLSASATFAQASATANASAVIVTPIAISKTSDLSFGNVAVGSNGAGTVVLSPNGSRNPTNVTLPGTAGTVSAASFTVTGAAAYTYAVTLPTAPVTITDGGSNSMTVNAFTSNTTGTLTGGSQILKVGATLNVSATQAAGSYASTTPFEVTVNYN